MKKIIFIICSCLLMSACGGGGSSGSSSGGGSTGTVTVNCAAGAVCAPDQVSAIPAK